jgi:hypothetical protein
MSAPSDYLGGMALSVTDHEAEALLTRSGYVSDDLLEVAAILDAVRTAALPQPGADYSHLFEAAVRESRLTPIERFANEHIMITDDWKPKLVPKLAIGALAFFALITMSSGFAYAANGASPGDLLYGIDRALEVVGIGDGGAGERLAEAQALVAGGQLDDNLTTTTDAPDDAADVGSAAIAEAATRLADGQTGPDDETAVETLLTYINEHKGGDIDGQEVARLAHMIGTDSGDSGNAPGHDPDGPGNSENAPGHQDDTTSVAPDQQTDEGPGNSENAPGHDPNGPGNSENAPGHDPNGPGNSENVPGQTKTTGP